jgi:hypothetical protein
MMSSFQTLLSNSTCAATVWNPDGTRLATASSVVTKTVGGRAAQHSQYFLQLNLSVCSWCTSVPVHLTAWMQCRHGLKSVERETLPRVRGGQREHHRQHVFQLDLYLCTMYPTTLTAWVTYEYSRARYGLNGGEAESLVPPSPRGSVSLSRLFRTA